MNTMNVVYMNIEDVIPYANNPRNNEKAIDKVASSIKEFGFKVPIVVDKDNVVITGHTRLLASKKLGLTEVPVIIANDLNKAQVKAFRLADNRVSEYAEWNDELLNIELEALAELDFSMGEFDFKLEALEDDEVFEEKEDDKPEVEFSEELLEKHNYVVLYFDNQVDWLQAETLFDIKTVKAKNESKREMKGVGRVVNGSKALNKILGGN